MRLAHQPSPAILVGLNTVEGDLEVDHGCDAALYRTLKHLRFAYLPSLLQLGELEKECENGRLLRILIKLGFVNERPELNGASFTR